MAKKPVTKLTAKHHIGYGAGDAGGVLMLMVISYLERFSRNILGIDPLVYAGILVVWNVWDAINDPLVGTFMDFAFMKAKNKANKCAGIDISPAVRDYLGIKGGIASVHWRFVEFHRVPGGPWARFGKDNPFINPELKRAILKYQKRHNIITTDRRNP